MKTSEKQAPNSLDNYKYQMDKRAELTAAKKRIEEQIAELDAELRPALAGRGPVVWNGYQFEVAMVKGRTTYDYKKMEADGIDLEPYKKMGAPTTRFTVKSVNELT